MTENRRLATGGLVTGHAADVNRPVGAGREKGIGSEPNDNLMSPTIE